MRELSLDRLRTLVTIADLGSFAAAAQALHLAPPTVSLHIAELEQRIGAPLLLRRRGQVRPSGVGETLHFVRYAANARRDGFSGMLAIHPAQIDVINKKHEAQNKGRAMIKNLRSKLRAKTHLLRPKP